MENINTNFEIKVIDNFFPPILFREIKKKILYTEKNIWQFAKNVTGDIRHVKSSDFPGDWGDYIKLKDPGGFFLTVIDNEENQIIYDSVKTFSKKKFFIDINKILRIHVNFIPPDPLHDQEYILSPHVDRYTPHYSFLYYLTENEGETLFFNQKFEEEKSPDYKNTKIIYKVKPEENRAVLFNGFVYHSGNVSKIKNRITMNVNFI